MDSHGESAHGRHAHADEGVCREDVVAILRSHGDNPAELVSILQDIQAKYRYLPQDALRIVAQVTRRPLVDVYAAATFYKSFSLKPKGEHLILSCQGTACHVRGASGIVEELQRRLGVGPGETTPDKKFTLETVNCLGACALGPVVVVDGHYFSKVRKSKIRQLIRSALKGLDKVDLTGDKRLIPLDVSCARCYHTLMDPEVEIDGRPSIGLAASVNGTRGLLNLSSVYGSYSLLSEQDVPRGAVATFFCPHCEAELIDAWECPLCGAPMSGMVVRGGGTLHVCTRRGCKNHLLDLV